ncbi:hypothetical protein H4S03_007469, partial [Coemansia sp. S3946]
IDKNTVDVLNRKQVFRSNYKNLEVFIDKTYPDEDLMLISDADMNKFFSSLQRHLMDLDVSKYYA